MGLTQRENAVVVAGAAAAVAGVSDGQIKPHGVGDGQIQPHGGDTSPAPLSSSAGAGVGPTTSPPPRSSLAGGAAVVAGDHGDVQGSGWPPHARMQRRPSCYTGVRHQRASGELQWLARISDGGVQRPIGWFSTEDAAARAYDQAARQLRGSHAHGGRTQGTRAHRLNFPTPAEQAAAAETRIATELVALLPQPQNVAERTKRAPPLAAVPGPAAPKVRRVAGRQRATSDTVTALAVAGDTMYAAATDNRIWKRTLLEDTGTSIWTPVCPAAGVIGLATLSDSIYALDADSRIWVRPLCPSQNEVAAAEVEPDWKLWSDAPRGAIIGGIAIAQRRNVLTTSPDGYVWVGTVCNKLLKTTPENPSDWELAGNAVDLSALVALPVAAADAPLYLLVAFCTDLKVWQRWTDPLVQWTQCGSTPHCAARGAAIDRDARRVYLPGVDGIRMGTIECSDAGLAQIVWTDDVFITAPPVDLCPVDERYSPEREASRPQWRASPSKLRQISAEAVTPVDSAFAGMWTITGTIGSGPVQEYITLRTVITSDSFTCAHVQGPHVHMCCLVESSEDLAVFKNTCIDVEKQTIRFEQHYSDGVITHWAARYDEDSDLLVQGIWSGACKGSFVAQRRMQPEKRLLGCAASDTHPAHSAGHCEPPPPVPPPAELSSGIHCLCCKSVFLDADSFVNHRKLRLKEWRQQQQPQPQSQPQLQTQQSQQQIQVESDSHGHHEWVQCEVVGCDKWRRLPPTVAPSAFPGAFECRLMHWVGSHASCESSAYRGVTWDDSMRKWRVVYGNFDGHFDAEELAALAYDRQVRKALGKRARLKLLNFPDGTSADTAADDAVKGHCSPTQATDVDAAPPSLPEDEAQTQASTTAAGRKRPYVKGRPIKARRVDSTHWTMYTSMRIAENATGKCRKSIAACCGRKGRVNGWVFEYADGDRSSGSAASFGTADDAVKGHGSPTQTTDSTRTEKHKCPVCQRQFATVFALGGHRSGGKCKLKTMTLGDVIQGGAELADGTIVSVEFQEEGGRQRYHGQVTGRTSHCRIDGTPGFLHKIRFFADDEELTIDPDVHVLNLVNESDVDVAPPRLLDEADQTQAGTTAAGRKRPYAEGRPIKACKVESTHWTMYTSMRKAENATRESRGSIAACCDRKGQVNGWVFEYADGYRSPESAAASAAERKPERQSKKAKQVGSDGFATVVSARATQARCLICQEHFKDMDGGTPVSTLNCDHSFCSACIEGWFVAAVKRSCPVCRKCFSGLRHSTKNTAAGMANDSENVPQSNSANPIDVARAEGQAASNTTGSNTLAPGPAKRRGTRSAGSRQPHGAVAPVQATRTPAKLKATRQEHDVCIDAAGTVPTAIIAAFETWTDHGCSETTHKNYARLLCTIFADGVRGLGLWPGSTLAEAVQQLAGNLSPLDSAGFMKAALKKLILFLDSRSDDSDLAPDDSNQCEVRSTTSFDPRSATGDSVHHEHRAEAADEPMDAAAASSAAGRKRPYVKGRPVKARRVDSTHWTMYTSMRKAEDATGEGRMSIAACCGRKGRVNGWMFEYADGYRSPESAAASGGSGGDVCTQVNSDPFARREGAAAVDTAAAEASTGSKAVPAVCQPDDEHQLISRRVRRHFAGFGWYEGTVMSVLATGLFEVLYDDGEVKRTRRKELDRIILVP